MVVFHSFEAHKNKFIVLFEGSTEAEVEQAFVLKGFV